MTERSRRPFPDPTTLPLMRFSDLYRVPSLDYPQTLFERQHHLPRFGLLHRLRAWARRQTCVCSVHSTCHCDFSQIVAVRWPIARAFCTLHAANACQRNVLRRRGDCIVRRIMIKKVGRRWFLYDSKGTRILGRHDTARPRCAKSAPSRSRKRASTGITSPCLAKTANGDARDRGTEDEPRRVDLPAYEQHGAHERDDRRGDVYE